MIENLFLSILEIIHSWSCIAFHAPHNIFPLPFSQKRTERTLLFTHLLCMKNHFLSKFRRNKDWIHYSIFYFLVSGKNFKNILVESENTLLESENTLLESEKNDSWLVTPFEIPFHIYLFPCSSEELVLSLLFPRCRFHPFLIFSSF